MNVVKWITFCTYCILNFLLGMHFYNVYPNITILGDYFLGHEAIDDINSYFRYVYPFLYIVLGPFCFNFIWKSFYWSNCVAWVCVLAGIWLKFMSYDNKISIIIGHILLVSSTSLALPGIGVLSLKYFKFQDYFLSLNWSSMSHLFGLILGAILKDQDQDLNLILVIQGLLGLTASIFFALFSEEDPVVGKSINMNFFQSLKIMFKTKDEGILFMMISCEIGFIYCHCIGIPYYMKELYDKNVDVYKNTDIFMLMFLGSSILGSFVSLYLFSRSYSIGFLVRVYMGISFLIMFLIKFVLKVMPFNYIFVVVLGITVLPTIPLLLIVGLSIHKNIMQPISINLAYYFGLMFLAGFSALASGAKVLLGVPQWVSYSCIQFLILTVFLSVYDLKTDKKFFKMKKKY